MPFVLIHGETLAPAIPMSFFEVCRINPELRTCYDYRNSKLMFVGGAESKFVTLYVERSVQQDVCIQ